MKKIKITEAQAEAIHNKLSKKTLKITTSQLEMIKESLGGGAAVTKNWKMAAQQEPGLKGMKVEGAEGLLTEYGTVELLEFARWVIELVLEQLNNPSQDGLDRIWRDMDITKGEMLTFLSNAGLWGFTFFKLAYSDKVRAIGRGIKPLYHMVMGKKGMGESGIQTDETQPHYKPEQLIGALDIPNTRAEVDWSNRKQYTIPSLDTGDASSIVHDKEFFTGRQFETRIGKKVVEDGYVKAFAKKFGEMPVFQISGRDIRIVNPVFLKWKQEYIQGKGATLDQWGSAESTGAASSGAVVGAMGGAPSDDYNDELAPSNNVADNQEGMITDAVTDTEELKGIELCSDTACFVVDGIEDKVITAEGNVIFMVKLKDGEGTPTQSHLFFRYNISNNKMSLMYAADEVTHLSAFKAFPEAYHQNLNTVSEILARMATQTTESASYGGGSNVGAYDAPGFAKGRGEDGFDVFNHDGSKVNGGVMEGVVNEMALTLQHDKENGVLGVASDEKDSSFSSQDTFMIKDVLKKDGFRWNADIKMWTLPEKDFEKAKETVARANGRLADELDKRTTTPRRDYGDKEVKGDRMSRARKQADVLIGKLEDLAELVADSGAGGNFVMDKIKTYVNDLANATDEETLSAEFRRYLTFFAKFHKYSFNNKMLIYIQNPKSTRVAGMVSWKKNFGRGIKRGSKAIWILVPLMSKRKDEKGNVMMTTDAEGNSVPSEQLVGFKGGKVFDIADTYPYDKENGDIPEQPQWWGDNEESDTASELVEYLKIAATNMGINMTKDAAKGGEKGFSAGDHINLSSDIKGVGEASTMAHEFAHELMHWKKSSPFYQQGTDSEETNKMFTRDSALWELQAESVSYVVLKHYGLPVKNHPKYLALWKANKDKILANMELISKVAQFILDKVDDAAKKYPNISKEVEVGAGESAMREAIKGALKEVSNLDDATYPDGGFVDIDNCAKLNNNKEAQNGGCSQGDDGVVTVKKTKNSVISNQKGD